MTVSDYVTISVAILSIFTNLIMSKSVFNSNQEASGRVTASAIVERLKSTQGHIRDIAPQKYNQRGFNPQNRIALIRADFDHALASMPNSGKYSKARDSLKRAQSQLNLYEQEVTTTSSTDTWEALQIKVQDTIEKLK